MLAKRLSGVRRDRGGTALGVCRALARAGLRARPRRQRAAGVPSPAHRGLLDVQPLPDRDRHGARPARSARGGRAGRPAARPLRSGPRADESDTESHGLLAMATMVEIVPGKPYGFFTDTSVCIGCKACEVACKEWNQLPEKDVGFLGESLDNTGELNGST